MKITLHQINLPLAHPFTIARGTLTNQPSLIVQLSHDGVDGFGEVTENEFYGHTFDSMQRSLGLATQFLDDFITHTPQEMWPNLNAAMDGDMFALSALDIAAHDLWCKRKRVAAWQEWGLSWENVTQSSYTIGIDSIDVMIGKLQERPDWGIYKIKLGTERDLEIVTELRKHTEAVFRVDANCGWTADETVVNSRALAKLGVEFIEQPLPMEASRDDKLKVFRESALPVVADEDCQVKSDVAECDGLYHGVNVKICKCGGLSPALSMLRQAKSLGMKTMVGCMIESSIGISGAAQLLPLLDYADLDGAVLLRDEPASGVTIDRGVVQLADRFGCGGALDFDCLEQYQQTVGG